ncbi:MAG: hypothetical protein ABEI75_01835 [Halobaculum sp.]
MPSEYASDDPGDTSHETADAQDARGVERTGETGRGVETDWVGASGGDRVVVVLTGDDGRHVPAFADSVAASAADDVHVLRVFSRAEYRTVSARLGDSVVAPNAAAERCRIVRRLAGATDERRVRVHGRVVDDRPTTVRELLVTLDPDRLIVSLDGWPPHDATATDTFWQLAPTVGYAVTTVARAEAETHTTSDGAEDRTDTGGADEDDAPRWFLTD